MALRPFPREAPHTLLPAIAATAMLLATASVLLAEDLGSPLSSGASPQTWPTAELSAFLDRHCLECHDEASAEGSLDLVTLGGDLSDPAILQRWVRVHDQIASGEMPPEKKPRPGSADTRNALQELASSLTAADERRRETALRRVNRREYENTLSDLFGQRVRVADLLPEDARLHGFDTVGEALAVSMEQMQAYLAAADAALDQVFAQQEKPEPAALDADLREDWRGSIGEGKLFRDTGEGIVLFQAGYNPAQIRSFRPVHEGTYRFTVRARAHQSEGALGLRIYAGDVLANRRGQRLVGCWEMPAPESAEAPTRWTTVQFEEHMRALDTIHLKPYGVANAVRPEDRFHGPGVEVSSVRIEGPLEKWPPPGRERLLGDIDPARGDPGPDEIARILRRFLPRAFRRPAEPGEEAPFLALAITTLEDGRSWMEALRVALKGVLCSPEFLFLEESGGSRLDDHAFANRLSYFLTGTLPDPELRGLADAGGLGETATVRAQVDRLLDGPRFMRFVTDFTDQWLLLREIDETEPDPQLYPEYDDVLRLAMLGETRRFFAELVEKDRPLGELIDSDWTYLNRRLARHYGIEGVAGHELLKVRLPEDSPRGGLLAQASVLKVTANGTTTSPVRRGVWFLENILGEPSPPPPASVPGLEPDIRGTVTIREQLAKHSADRSCATCHARIDPPGFALEGFDVIGGRRDFYRSLGEGEPTDREIPFQPGRRVRYLRGPAVDEGGEDFADFNEFRENLLGEKERVVRCVAEKLLTYALGRGLGFSDRDEIEAIVDKVAEKNYGTRTLVHEVVASPLFREP